MTIKDIVAYCGVSVSADSSIGQLRFQGYRRALEAEGIAYDPALAVITGNYAMGAAYEGVCRLLDSGADFTALLAISDSLAIAAIKALTDRGVHVPRDCSVIAIDGLEMSSYIVPAVVFYLTCQKHIIKGVAAGAVKG